MDFELPEKITIEFLMEQKWVSGPLEYFEICELGLVRRPLSMEVTRGLMQPGFLYGPENKSGFIIKYRLHKLGNKKPNYYSPKEIMEKCFGRFLNTKLDDLKYVIQLRILLTEFNSRVFRPERKSPVDEEAGTIPMRFCATCGKPTRDYRCEACWTKIRAAGTACDEPTAEYRIGRR